MVSVICGANSAITASARAWFSGAEPAQASATTRRVAPASAAGRAVASTQQSVATPVSTRCGSGPVTSASAGHFPNVVAVTTGAPRSASGSTTA